MPIRSKNIIDADDPRVAKFGHPAPPWLVNYADLMTEMVAFFIILYALSAALSKPIQEAAKQAEEMMKKEEIAGEVKVTREGLRITMQEYGENVFFETGKADLQPKMIEILDKLTPTLINFANKRFDIIIEGYTDERPIKSAEFASNWELSTARSTNVVKYLIDKNLPPNKIAAIGYGEFRPLPRNEGESIESWWSRNRRVVFFIKNPPPKGED